jgi:predicted esterase
MIRLSSTIIKISLLLLFILSFGFLYSKNYIYSEIKYGDIFRIPELGSVYLPKSYSIDKKYPLMVVLHPRFGSSDLQFIRNFIDEAEKREIIVIAPKDYDETRNYPDTKKIKQMVFEIKKKFSIDSKNVLLYGFSSGGSFTHEVVATNKDKCGEKFITAYCSVSGGTEYDFEYNFIRKDRMPDHLKIPAYFIWGKMEESQAEKEVANFLLNKGWDVTVKVHDGGHYIPEGSIAEVLDWFQSKCSD